MSADTTWQSAIQVSLLSSFTRLDVVTRDEIEKLTERFVILNEILQDSSLLDFLQARSGRLGRDRLARLSIESLRRLSLIKYLIDALFEACDQSL